MKLCSSLSYVAAAVLLVAGPSLCAAAEVASVSLDRSALHELSDSDLKDLLPALSAIAVITKCEANARAYSAAHAEVLERAATFAKAASASAGDRPLQSSATTARDALRALSPVVSGGQEARLFGGEAAVLVERRRGAVLLSGGQVAVFMDGGVPVRLR